MTLTRIPTTSRRLPRTDRSYVKSYSRELVELVCSLKVDSRVLPSVLMETGYLTPYLVAMVTMHVTYIITYRNEAIISLTI